MSSQLCHHNRDTKTCLNCETALSVNKVLTVLTADIEASLLELRILEEAGRCISFSEGKLIARGIIGISKYSLPLLFMLLLLLLLLCLLLLFVLLLLLLIYY